MNPCLSGVCAPAAMVAALMLCAGSACAVSGTWDPARSEALAEWGWVPPQRFELPGAHVQLWRFRAPMAPLDAAQRLTHAGKSRLDRLQFSGVMLSLSGLHEGRHWLAQLRPADDGTSGTIGLLSSLEPAERRTRGFDPGTLAPAGARPVLRASSRLAGGPGVLASYLCPGSYPRVAAAVRRALWDQRWRPLGVSGLAKDVAAPVAGEWMQPDGSRLTVHLHPRADAVVLTLWHRSKETP